MKDDWTLTDLLTLTVVCLEGLGLDYLTTVVAHHQIEVVLCGTLAKYWHVCSWEKNQTQRAQVKVRQKKIDQHLSGAPVNGTL